MKFTEEQDNAIWSAKLSYGAYITDPWRCDYCDPDCECDQYYLDVYVQEIIDKFPELEEVYDEVENRIND